MEPGNEEDMSDPRAVASGEDERREHDESRMRLIHIGQKGSGTAHEEQLDKFTFRARSYKFSVIFNHACVSSRLCEW